MLRSKTWQERSDLQKFANLKTSFLESRVDGVRPWKSLLFEPRIPMRRKYGSPHYMVELKGKLYVMCVTRGEAIQTRASCLNRAGSV